MVFRVPNKFSMSATRIASRIKNVFQQWQRFNFAIYFLLLISIFYFFYLILLAFFGPSGVRERKNLALFGALHVEPKRPLTPHVWLLIGAHKMTYGIEFSCFSRSRDGRVKTAVAPLVQLQPGPLQCMWTIYRVQCPVVEDMTEFSIADGKSDAERVGTRIPYRAADKTRRQVVVCQSRFFMYDKWQILFTIIELYRFYGADMIAAYVESIIAEAFEFLKRYKERGFIAIHPAVRYENFPDLDYDPNNETEYNQQLSAYNLCLYEYRDSTDFIIFGDWDEVLIPRNASNYFDDLSIILTEYENAASFRHQRMHVQTYIPKQSSFFDLADIVTTTRSVDRFGPTKVVVVGNRVDSVGIHWVTWGAPRTREIMLTTEHSFFLHFREEGKRNCEDDEVAELFPMLNTTELADNFTEFIRDENLYTTYVNLPSELVYADAYVACYIHLAGTLGHPEWGICPNHLVCPTPQPDHPVPCVKLRLRYNRFVLRDAVVLSFPERISFETKDGCR